MHTLLLFATCLKIRWTVMNIPTASMKCVFTLPVLLFALFAFPGLCMAQGSVAEDKAALQALYNATDGDNWNSNTNWNSTEPLRQWYGVRVDPRTGRVTSISLSGNNLNGSIPVEIGDLTALKELGLYNNSALTGGIPSSIGDLTALEELSPALRLSGALRKVILLPRPAATAVCVREIRTGYPRALTLRQVVTGT